MAIQVVPIYHRLKQFSHFLSRKAVYKALTVPAQSIKQFIKR